MRLGQLARRLSIRPSQIVDYLSARQIFFEEGSNAKLKDEEVSDIVSHFAPSQLSEILTLQKEEEPEVPSAPVVQVEQETKSEGEDTVIANTNEIQEKPEVIKAPKIELSGLKVLGKIELPQPKKKEPDVSGTEESTGDSVQPEKSRLKRPKAEEKKKVEKPWRNPIALQREREAREKEAHQKAALEKQKEKKKEHYLKRVKVGQPTKPARIVEEPLEQALSEPQQARPRTWWGRFMRWLNT